MVDCLRKVPVAKLISNTTAQTAVNTVNAAIIASDYFKSSAIVASIEPFLPIVDKAAGIIDDQFVKLLRSETLPNAVPTLFITVKDEVSCRLLCSLGACSLCTTDHSHSSHRVHNSSLM